MKTLPHNKRLIRRTVLQIDLRAIAHNISAIRKRLGGKVALLCVVKADVYGHGAVETS